MVFIFSAFYFYLRPNAERRKIFNSFLIITFYSLAIMEYLSSGAATVWMAVLFGVFFFLLLGIKEFVFVKKENAFNFLSGFLYFLISIVFFSVDKSTGFSFFFYFALTFFVYYKLFKELFDFSYPDFPKTKKTLIVAGSALIIMELASAISLLPLGFLNASALILLFIFILEDLIFYHIKGGLSRETILNNATILIVAAILIFATSKLAL